MKATRTALLLAGASAAALAAAGEARAQAALEEVVVTARRIEENLQSVPIAITALSPETLTQRDVRSIADLQHAVPGLSICCDRTGTSFTWMRGIPGVIGYFAQAPVDLSGPFIYFDLANVQALKGPQGTLFGLSANAGALLYEPRRPGSTFSIDAQATFGGFHRRDFNLGVDLPVNDKVRLRFAGQTHDQDGYIRDINTGQLRNDEHDWEVRGSAIIEPFDGFENYTVFNYGERDDTGDAKILRDVDPTQTAARAFPGLVAALAQQNAIGPYNTIEGAPAGGIISQAWLMNVVNHTTYDVSDDVTLKNILSYSRRTSFQRGTGSTDGTPFPIFGGGDPRNVPNAPTTRWTEEVQVIGNLLDHKLKAQGGFFFSKDREPIPQDINYSTSVGSTSGAALGRTGNTKALYAQGTYDFSELVLEGLSFTAGYRYSWDKRGQFNQNYTGTGVPSGTASDRHGKWKAGSWNFSASWEFETNRLLYVTYSKGYSSGGFNNPQAIPQQQLFDPESLTNLEGGIKADWEFWGIQARTNLSGFYGWYDNVQVQQTSQIITPSGAPSIAVLTLNAATGHIEGFDAEVTVIPTSWLEISGAFLYVTTGYDDFSDIRNGVVVDLSATQFPYVPKMKYTLNATIHLPFIPEERGDVSFAVDYSREDRKRNTVILDPRWSFWNPPQTDLKLTLNWNDVWGYKGMDVAVFGTNLTNEVWSTSVVPVQHTALAFYSHGVQRPRTWGMRLRYRYD